jgi:hypothetical protein
MNVRIGPNLIKEVADHMRTLRSRERESLREASNVSDEYIELDVNNPVLDQIRWQGFAAEAAKLPGNWFITSRRFYCEVTLTESQKLLINTTEPKMTVAIQLDHEVIHSPLAATRSYADKQVFSGELLPEVTHMFELTGKLSASTHRWDRVIKEVTKYLELHKSLNTAVKEMPAIKAYLPRPMLERLEAANAERPKPKGATAAESVDFGLIAATAMKVRMDT